MKLIDTKDAVGQVLCHDITQIIKGVKKGRVFKKGHVVREEDIPVLLSVGKEHLYIFEKDENMLHENDAAEILRVINQGENIEASEVKEGKIELFASCDGLFKLDIETLDKLNDLDDICISTIQSNYPVKKGDKLCGMRVTPLLIEKEKMNEVKKIAGCHALMNVLPFKPKKVGIVTTGSEVYNGIIKDGFGSVIRAKFAQYDAEILGQDIVDDKMDMICSSIKKYLDMGADIIICTGGMSVDPDDITPTAIKESGAEIISYGAPVLPGAMFLLSYFEGRVPILGLPGGVMFAPTTVFDLVLPRIMADEVLTKKDIKRMWYGGLCLGCKTCHYPNCNFGKSK